MQKNIRNPKPPKGWHAEHVRRGGNVVDTIWLRNGYHHEPCPGQAHSEPNIDNCGMCSPLWGVIAVANDLAPEQVTIHKPEQIGICQGITCKHSTQPQVASPEPHTCPYAEEIHDDTTTKCSCCEGCTRDCAQEI